MARTRRISPKIDIRISLSKGQDGYIVAECLDIPGCISQGETEAEAVDNLHDVISTTFAMIVRDWMKKANTDGVYTSPINAKHKEVKVTFVRMRKTA
ncbi:MAG TPA: type II toxin-antitoxin system HicB family antitoxin [Candidatus Angelobacter sp.]